tara:strand:+ start:113 stop:580 length:468 start_codon:yes stop_codon:yes gene_type:complete
MISNNLIQNIKYFNQPKDLLDRWLIYPDGNIVEKKTGKLKYIGKRQDGYRAVWLDKKYNYHRLLGKAFIPNPNNLPEIDHIDRDRGNNDLSNLRWADRYTQQHNTSKNGHIAQRKHKGVLGKYRARVTHNGKNYSKDFVTIVEAEEYINQIKNII